MDHLRRVENGKGFTLIEVLMAVVVLGIVTAIAIPNFMTWLPDARLKTAARDVFSNLQLTKMEAIKANSDYILRFDPAAGTYQMEDKDGNVKTVVQLSEYGSGVRFGSSTATAVPGDLGPIVADFISYADNKSEFYSRGTGKDGYIYLTNDRGTSYAVGSLTSGAVVLRKWNGASWT